MAASHTLSHQPAISQIPRHGVLTLYGFGIRVTTQNGHLAIEDGIGPDRRKFRLPRVGHGLKRLICIGNDGFVSLGALRWLADQDAAFSMLERDGSVLLTSGPVRPSDARLRRAQALAHQSGTAIRIARELIDKKLAAQEQVVRRKLQAIESADAILRYRSELAEADTEDSIRLIESHAAHAYWSAWRTLPISFPRNDLSRVPEHWRTFGTRVSPLTGSPRLAANPPNAILNYLYAVLESESRLAAATLGLDPGLGVLHVDSPKRDSLASDLMEPIRPEVDSFLLNWIMREQLSRSWFFEQRDGNCRLMAPFAARLAETAPTWHRAVAPIAEWVARTFWEGIPKSRLSTMPATRLTQQHKREAKGQVGLPSVPVPQPQRVCRRCGVVLKNQKKNHCASCGVTVSCENMLEIAHRGRIASRSPESRAKLSASQKRQRAVRRAWNPSTLPAWLTRESYREKILPRLTGITVPVLMRTLNISEPYATKVRNGQFVPHPMHWLPLAQLVGVHPPVK
jgi:CRISPR-associated endonuclease Cas1